MNRKSFFLISLLAILALVMVSGCATKKWVRQEVNESEKKTEQKIEAGDQKLQGQINELSALNKQLNSKIEQVNDKAERADAKAEEAKGIGMDAKRTAEGAVQNVNELRVKFDNRNNFTVVDTKTVWFDLNKHALKADGEKTLDDVLRIVAGNKNTIVVLEGFTCELGDKEYNYNLSEKRVLSVKRYLVEKNLDLNRIYNLGLGENNPVGDNKTKAGREQNRRVVIQVLEVK
ncbi:MAG: OmpA family protein [Acidobacteria bacterium]|nr:OmpA family protein [Acidobacteriota bacterium]